MVVFAFNLEMHKQNTWGDYLNPQKDVGGGRNMFSLQKHEEIT